VIAWVVGVAALVGMSGPVKAEPPLPAFGMAGLATGQVAILTLVLTDAPDDLDCRVRGAFVNATGQVFIDATGHEVMKDFTLQPNVADTLRLRSADILAGQARTLIRAVLTPVPNDPTESDCTRLIANVEIVNASTGETSVLIYPAEPPRGGGNPPVSREE
jgi:hypothetical protein